MFYGKVEHFSKNLWRFEHIDGQHWYSDGSAFQLYFGTQQDISESVSEHVFVILEYQFFLGSYGMDDVLSFQIPSSCPYTLSHLYFTVLFYVSIAIFLNCWSRWSSHCYRICTYCFKQTISRTNYCFYVLFSKISLNYAQCQNPIKKN